MLAKICAKLVHGFCIFSVGVVFLFGVMPVKAQSGTACIVNCVVGEDPFPWLAQSWQFTRQLAESGARSKANRQCSANGLERSVNQDQFVYGTTYATDCPPLSYCRTANLYYYCKERDPRYATRSIFNVRGPRVCDNYDMDPHTTPAATAWGTVAKKTCDNIDPGRGWFLQTIIDVRPSTIYTGSCGSGGPDGPSNTAYTGDIVCALQY